MPSEQFRFVSIPVHTVRADFAGSGLSSDLGPLLLRGDDRQIGLTERITAALDDYRHQSYISHSYRDLLTQRIFRESSGELSFDYLAGLVYDDRSETTHYVQSSSCTGLAALFEALG